MIVKDFLNVHKLINFAKVKCPTSTVMIIAIDKDIAILLINVYVIMTKTNQKVKLI